MEQSRRGAARLGSTRPGHVEYIDVAHSPAVNPSRRSVCKSLIASSGPLGIIR